MPKQESLIDPRIETSATANLPAQRAPGNPMDLLSMAVERGTDPAQLEKLTELYERWQRNQAAQAFADALASFQRDCPQIHKSRKADRFAYASYDDIMHQVQPVLADCGLSVSFDMEQTQANMMTCTVIVKGGVHEQRTKLTVPIPDSIKVSSTQQYGAAVSYVKRYALCAALNIVVTNEDREEALAEKAKPSQYRTALVRILKERRFNASEIGAVMQQYLADNHDGMAFDDMTDELQEAIVADARAGKMDSYLKAGAA